MLNRAASSLVVHKAGWSRMGMAGRAFSTSPKRVETIKDDETGICHVVLSRPEKRNGVDYDMYMSLAETAYNVRNDDSIRAVILRGEGKAFCSGLDMKSFIKSGNPMKIAREIMNRPSPFAKEGNEITNIAQDVSYLWREVPVPVIASVHGNCYGAGLQIAMGADVRFVTPDVEMSIMEIKFGLVPDMCGTILLRELVRLDVAKELTMTGRIVNGEEAVQLGLATKVCQDPLQEAEAYAKDLISRSPEALAAGKELFNKTWLASEKDCLELETELQKKLVLTSPAFQPRAN